MNGIDAVFDDPQVVARGLSVEVLRPDGERAQALASPIVIDGVRQVSTRAPPGRGGQGGEIDWDCA